MELSFDPERGTIQAQDVDWNHPLLIMGSYAEGMERPPYNANDTVPRIGDKIACLMLDSSLSIRQAGAIAVSLRTDVDFDVQNLDRDMAAFARIILRDTEHRQFIFVPGLGEFEVGASHRAHGFQHLTIKIHPQDIPLQEDTLIVSAWRDVSAALGQPVDDLLDLRKQKRRAFDFEGDLAELKARLINSRRTSWVTTRNFRKA